eukprot:2495341-Rhodomonas_salina.1
MAASGEEELIGHGAEAKVFLGTFCGKACVVKERLPKAYRHPSLEESLSKRRLNQVRAMAHQLHARCSELTHGSAAGSAMPAAVKEEWCLRSVEDVHGKDRRADAEGVVANYALRREDQGCHARRWKELGSAARWRRDPPPSPLKRSAAGSHKLRVGFAAGFAGRARRLDVIEHNACGARCAVPHRLRTQLRLFDGRGQGGRPLRPRARTRGSALSSHCWSFMLFL